MKKLLITLACTVLFSQALYAQSVTLPKSVEGNKGRLISVSIDYDGDDIKWTTTGDIDVFREYDPDPKKIRLKLLAPNDGKYELKAVTCKDKKLSDFSVCVITIGKGPDPTPVPPGPNPPNPPDPPTPAPIEGKRCIIIYSEDDRSKYPAKQELILTAGPLADYLNSKCDTESDGKHKAWRVWDAKTDTTNESKTWQDAMKRERKSIPWIIVSNGKTGFEGPLPGTLEETLTLVKKYLD